MDEPANFSQLQNVLENAVGAIIALAGIILFIMLLLGGIKYITSGGEPKAVESARHTLTYAIGGLVLVLLSYLILYIIGQVTGATNITNFNIIQQP